MTSLDPDLHAWCTSALGPFEIVSDASREHAGQRAAAHRLRAAGGSFYLKTHRDPAHWESETHAYERWAHVFGSFAPRLVAARDIPPLALLISTLPGVVLEDARLSPVEERGVWRSAGRSLAGLHALPSGAFFGPCRRDGTPAGEAIQSAVQYVTRDLENLLERGLRAACLSSDERSFIRDSRVLIPAFAGVQPTACHRDFCPPNWLVARSSRGWEWTGVIDFEFSRWDVRAADYTRYPEFDWIQRPDLADAFFEGYGRAFTPTEQQQRLFCHVLYALGAVVWGMENEYYVFAREGREALSYLRRQIDL